MGHIEVEATIYSLDGKKMVKTRALVDTGAMLTAIPKEVADNLGIEPSGEKIRLQTAKGVDELGLAHVIIEIMGRKRILPVLISGSIDRVLIGVTTLEAMQLRVNPVTEKLEEYLALLYLAMEPAFPGQRAKRSVFIPRRCGAGVEDLYW